MISFLYFLRYYIIRYGVLINFLGDDFYEVTVNDNESILNVTMKSPALTGVMEEIQKKSMQNLDKLMGKSGKELEEESKKIFSEVISQKLNSPDLKYNEETFDVIYTKKGNTWEISPEKNEKLLKALTLGIKM